MRDPEGAERLARRHGPMAGLGLVFVLVVLGAAALATIAGEPLKAEDGFAQVLGAVLAAYSVVVFATVAAALGAYFLRLAPGAPVEAVREPIGRQPGTVGPEVDNSTGRSAPGSRHVV